MTSEPTPAFTRIRPRLTAAPGSGRVHAALPLPAAADHALARISGGRPLEEIVVLAAAVTLVVASAERTLEPAIAVTGPAGPLPFAVDLSARPSVATLVRTVDAALRQVSAARSESSPDLSDTLLVGSERIGPEPRAAEPGGPAVEVTLSAAGTGGRLLRAEADAAVVEEWFLAVVLRAIAAVLTGFTESSRDVGGIRAAAVEDVDETARFGWAAFNPEPAATTLTAPIEAIVGEHPERIALVAGDERMTYRDLWRTAERVATYLVRLGVAAGDRVALLTDKAMHTVPAILGVLLVRAAYVPLDTQSPGPRLAAMLADARCRFVLAAGDLADRLRAEDVAVPVIDVATAVDTAAAGAVSTLPRPVPADVAYVIYTSGSTGTPKGVVVRHVAIASYLRWKVAYNRLSSDVRLLQIPALAFDSSVSDFFSVLSAGGRLVLVDVAHQPPRRLAELVAHHHITHLTVVPSLYRVMLDELAAVDASSLRLVTVAGEATTADLVGRHHATLDGVRLVNEYGPAENSVGATAFDHDVDAGPGCPIGRPIPNTVATVVGVAGNPQPTGFVGELCLAGHGLADGYCNRPDLTASVFITDSEAPGDRRYRTGDLAWWRPDAMVEFIGRSDDQIKIRGQRVELGEIENVLGRLPGVRSAVVVTAEGGDGTPELVAYLEGVDLTEREVRAGAVSRLPPAMAPGRIEVLDALPRTVSGKLDRIALEELAASAAVARSSAPAAAGVSGNEVESVVAAVFHEVLGGEPFEPDDDFLLRGGHSLSAVSAIGKLEERFGVFVDLDDFLASSTVREVAALVVGSDGDATDAFAGHVGVTASTAESHKAPVLRPVKDPEALLRLMNSRASDA